MAEKPSPRSSKSALRKLVIWAACLGIACGWTAFSFWVFSYAISDGYFEYHFYAGLPPFLTSFLAALAIPGSALWQWARARRKRTARIVVWFWHLLTTILCLVPFYLAVELVEHAPEPWRLAGEDTMALILNVLVLGSIAVLSAAALAIALGMEV
jgi:hypothetical protein